MHSPQTLLLFPLQNNNRGAFQNVKSGYSMQVITTNIIGPLRKSRNGNKYILVVRLREEDMHIFAVTLSRLC